MKKLKNINKKQPKDRQLCFIIYKKEFRLAVWIAEKNWFDDNGQLFIGVKLWCPLISTFKDINKYGKKKRAKGKTKG